MTSNLDLENLISKLTNLSLEEVLALVEIDREELEIFEEEYDNWLKSLPREDIIQFFGDIEHLGF